MGLSEPGAAVDEERVVAATRVFSDCGRRGGRQLIRIGNHVRGEGEAGVETVRPRARRVDCWYGNGAVDWCGLLNQLVADLNRRADERRKHLLEERAIVVVNPVSEKAIRNPQRQQPLLQLQRTHSDEPAQRVCLPLATNCLKNFFPNRISTYIEGRRLSDHLQSPPRKRMQIFQKSAR